MSTAVPLYIQVAKVAQDARNKPNGHVLRAGQSLMNALYDINPDLYKAITGTEADCFYSDKRVGQFYNALIDYEREQT